MTEGRMKLLLVEDNPADRFLLQEMLQDVKSFTAEFITKERLDDAIAYLQKTPVDVVLLDLGLPDSQGLSTFLKLHEAVPGTPALVLTGLDDEEMGRNALSRGAQDYLVKDHLQPNMLGRAITYAVERHRLARELESKAQELAESESRLRRILDVNSDAVVVVGSGGAVRFANPAARIMFDRTQEEFKFHGFAYPLEAGLRTNIEIVRSDGAKGTAEMRVLATQWGDEPVLLACMRDITVTMQAEFLRAQRLDSLGVLAGGIAHDFNNLLGIIIGNAELAEDALPRDHAAVHCLHNLLQVAQRGTELTRRLLAFNSGDTRLGPVRVEKIAQEVLHMVRSSVPASIRTKADFDESLPEVNADSTQVLQAIMNLCTNAIHAMADRVGNIQIRIRRLTVTDSRTSFAVGLMEGEYVVVSVSDDGCGIPEANLKMLFKPFFTTKTSGKGTGLGLSVVHGIMKNHNGAVTVVSLPEVGTTFSLYFPVASGLARTAESEKLHRTEEPSPQNGLSHVPNPTPPPAQPDNNTIEFHAELKRPA